MATAGIGANAWEQFNVVAIDETEPAFGVELDELLDIVRVDATVIAAGLPGLTGCNSGTPPSESRLSPWETDRCHPCDPNAHG